MMRIGSMFSDVVASLFKRPFTERYPFVVKPVTQRMRGAVDYDMAKCTGCMACVRDCPADAIQVKVVDWKTKKFIFRYRTDRCIYCAQCVSSCKTNALSMSPVRWHLASTDRKPFSVVYGEEALSSPGPALPPEGAASSSGQAPRR
jgi:formate hydrogenlyase subunit 6/NADH:ubiquinone oxidoreductase subunit I